MSFFRVQSDVVFTTGGQQLPNITDVGSNIFSILQQVVHDFDEMRNGRQGIVHSAAIFISGADESHGAAEVLEAAPLGDERCKKLTVLVERDLPIAVRGVKSGENAGSVGDVSDGVLGRHQRIEGPLDVTIQFREIHTEAKLSVGLRSDD